MVDLHMHILPGLDDGASSMEESIRMARQAAAGGVNYIAASSHGNYYDYTVQEYVRKFRLLQKELNRQQIPVKIFPSMEIFMNERAMQLILDRELLFINHTKYLMIEFDFRESPERYTFIQEDPELAYYLAERGCVLQVNKGSILGEFGKKCREMAIWMMDDGIVQVIASDAHDSLHRTPQMDELIHYLEQRYTSMEIKMWLSENPSRILKGNPTIRLR